MGILSVSYNMGRQRCLKHRFAQSHEQHIAARIAVESELVTIVLVEPLVQGFLVLTLPADPLYFLNYIRLKLTHGPMVEDWVFLPKSHAATMSRSRCQWLWDRYLEHSPYRFLAVSRVDCSEQVQTLSLQLA